MPRPCVSAADTGLPSDTRLSRRSLLAALPVAGAGLALPTVAPAAAPDPVVIHYRDWMAANRDLQAMSHAEDGDPLWEDAFARNCRAEEEMLKHVPTSLDGIAALTAVLWDSVGPRELPPEVFNREAENWDCLFIRGIWKACTGKDGYPETGRINPEAS